VGWQDQIVKDTLEEDSMKRWTLHLGLLIGFLVVSWNVLSNADEGEDQAGLAKAVANAIVTLEQGLLASAPEGKSISAKFELEDGKLQLSVYTAKGSKFFEVVVDHESGTIAKTESITSGEDLTAAKSQSEAMSKAKQSLRATLAKVLKGNPGFRAVSVFPSLKNGLPIAEVALIKGAEWKTVSEKLE
jgi:hypothetical protein